MIIKFKDSNGFWRIKENAKDLIYDTIEIKDEEHWENFVTKTEQDIKFLEEQNVEVEVLDFTYVKGGRDFSNSFKINYLMWDDNDKVYYLITIYDAYLLNNQGQTIERIN